MSNLANQYISQSYTQIINIGTGSGDNLSSNLQPLTDGFGNALPLNVSLTTIELKGNVSVTGSLVSSLIPAVSNSIDLGSPTKPFRHIYAGSGSFYMDDHQILSLQNNGSNTSLAAPSGGTLNLLNNIVFDSNNTNNLGSSITYVGKGPSNQTQHYYTGSNHFFNTDGNYVIQNYIDIANPGSGSITLNAINSGSININGDFGVQLTSAGFASIRSTGSLFLSSSYLSLGGEVVYASSPFNLSEPNTIQIAGNSTDTTQFISLVGKNVNNTSYALTSSIFNIGSYDFVNYTYDTELMVQTYPSGVTFSDWNNSTYEYSPFMTLPDNDGSDAPPNFPRGISISGQTYEPINTGSFATTGSNTFVGNQNINAGLTVTGITSVQGGLSFAGSNIINNTGSSVLTLQSGSNIVSYATFGQLAQLITGSYATTGSNTFNGNQNINGSINLSGSLKVSGSIDLAGFNVDGYGISLVDDNSNGYLTIYNPTSSTMNVGAWSGAYDNELNMRADSTGIYLQDWDNGVGDFSTFMSVGPNDGSGPAPVFTRGLNSDSNVSVTGYIKSTYSYTQVKMSSGQTVTAGSDTLIHFDNVVINNNGWFIATGHTFQPPVAGTYEITSIIQLGTGTSNGQMNMQIRKNGSTVLIVQDEVNKNVNHTLQGSVLVELNGSTDYVDVTFYTSSGNGSQTIQDNNASLFKAVLL